MSKAPKPPLELRLRVLAALDYAPGNSIRERIKAVATRTFTDADRNTEYRFTWRTISTWFYRFKKRGITTLDNKTRADLGQPLKVTAPQLAEAINDVLPSLARNKQGHLPASALYRRLLERGLFTRRQLAPTTFYRRLREHRLLDDLETRSRLRLTFAMPRANDLWQADTLHGLRRSDPIRPRSKRCNAVRQTGWSEHRAQPRTPIRLRRPHPVLTVTPLASGTPLATAQRVVRSARAIEQPQHTPHRAAPRRNRRRNWRRTPASETAPHS